MEIIEIKSGHSLVTSIVASRPVEAHSYSVNCRQYVTAYKDWQRTHQTSTQALGVMTLDFVRIWVTEQEGNQIAEAIHASRSPVVIE